MTTATSLPTSPARGEVPFSVPGSMVPDSPAGILRRAARVGEGVGQALRAIGIALIALFLVATPALAREEIRSFVSNVTLSPNGTVDVVETIAVNAEGDQIRHGIYRDIPTQSINPDKTRLRSDLHVVGVERDGRDETYSLEDIGGGFKRIRIGSADV